MTTARVWVGAGVLAAAFAGCGGGSTTPAEPVGAGTAAGRQACDVFTLEMARSILGDGARPSESATPFSGASDDIASSTCTYEAEDPAPTNRFATVMTATLLLSEARTDTGRRSHRSAFEENRTTLGETQPVEGVGDSAFYIGGVVNQLHALVDDAQYSVIVSARSPDGDHRDATEQLARMILDRL